MLIQNRILIDRTLGSGLRVGDYIAIWKDEFVQVQKLVDPRQTPPLCDGNQHEAITAVCDNGYEITVLQDCWIDIKPRGL